MLVAGEVVLLSVGLTENGETELPECGSQRAKETAVDAIKTSPMGKVLGLEIIDFGIPAEVKSNSGERRCTTKVLLNNGAERIAKYKIFTRSDAKQWFVEVEFGDE